MDQKRVAGEKSTEYIKDGMILGLGTGSTAYYMIKKVGELIKNGMKIKAVATSKVLRVWQENLRSLYYQLIKLIGLI
ncbi:ribose 5-phosphate isomerase [Clostridium beijerinckii]|nr:ribose 5-phosphate isomerase [Clostridium beijerinckii]